VTESYFQTKRGEELAEIRKRLAEIQQNALEGGPDYIRHEKKYPGRIAKFVDQAKDRLADAERMIPAMAPGPQQKALWTSFRKTLELADHCVRQALWDPSVQRDIRRQRGTKQKRGPRWPELDDDIRAMLEANPKASDKCIWNQLPESDELKTYYVDDDKIFNESGRELQFGGFSKRVSMIRKEFKKPR